MNYRYINDSIPNSSILGLGTMRLPLVKQSDDSTVNESAAISLIRHAIDEGINYIDTAYPYHGEKSECIVGKALKNGYREKVTLVTKLPVWKAEKHEDFERLLDEQLDKLEVDYLDVYLLHALNQERFDKCKRLNIFKFIQRAMDSGKIKNIGFSFHDEYPVFKKIIDCYDWDICMMQFNYMDQHEQATLEGLKYAGQKGVPVIIMEPLKGGLLVNIPDEARELIKDMSPVELSLRWIANFPQVKGVLSGMSSIDEVNENIEYAKKMTAGNLKDEQLKLVDQVESTLRSKIKVHCTKCNYCMPCPHGVNIPKNFDLYNKSSIYNVNKKMKELYINRLKDEMKANNCISCGQCEPKCPQDINIIDELKMVHKHLSE